jgi:uncharacterized protein
LSGGYFDLRIANQVVVDPVVSSAKSALALRGDLGTLRRDMMSFGEAMALATAGAAAGMVNAVAGGGTLITFPALLAFGTSSIVANATSTLALVAGTVGGVYGYRRHLQEVKPWLKRFVPVSLVGGLLGGILLTRTREHTFARMVPFLLFFATLLFLGQGVFRRWFGQPASPPASDSASQAQNGDSQWHPGPLPGGLVLAVGFQFLVALYGGYFGAGIGILMLASLGFLGLTDIHQMNSLKTILGSLINQVAAIYFIASGLIDWPRAGAMTMGALAGYFAGAHYSQRIPQRHVRQIITAIGFAISGVFFWKQFFSHP